MKHGFEVLRGQKQQHIEPGGSISVETRDCFLAHACTCRPTRTSKRHEPGCAMLLVYTAHGICFILHWAVTHQLSKQMLEWKRIGIANVAGEVALLSGLLMWITTIPRIRRQVFELFFYTHYLYILFIVFFIFHVDFFYACTMLPGFYLFLVDRYLSNLEPKTMSVVIKGEGTWSKKLCQMLSNPSAIDHINVSVEGPYGPASTNYLRSKQLALALCYNLILVHSFLILIGIISRYIIFPVDHNSNKIFSQPLRSFFNMFAICVSIAMAAGAAVLWNKKYKEKEAKRIQNLEGSSAESPKLNIDEGYKELESPRHQSLVQATKVHYGVRPDLRRLLFEFKGSRVGDFVSGPKKMRQEVAEICSSEVAENLHFESYSFNW
ncbi:hypothetical protein VNO78_15272 [Psophocarpus tetragonolobus]|uniref:Uncharacterized protein n=1 Tax=Psophocarpus tetragonolobus TaxID=3891 RepID=A0AAN9SG79_PSOTE